MSAPRSPGSRPRTPAPASTSPTSASPRRRSTSPPSSSGRAPRRRPRSRSSSGSSRPRSRRPRPAGCRAGCASPTTRSTSASPVRVRLPALDRPGRHRRAVHPALRRGAPQRAVPRTAGGREVTSRDRARDRRHRGRLPDLLHDRGRPRGPPPGGPPRGQLDLEDADVHRALGARHRRARLPAHGRHVRPLDLPGRVPPLRARLDRADEQPRLRRLGPGVRRPGRRDGHPRPAPAPRHGRQHQGPVLPDARPRPVRQGGRAMLG